MKQGTWFMIFLNEIVLITLLALLLWSSGGTLNPLIFILSLICFIFPGFWITYWFFSDKELGVLHRVVMAVMIGILGVSILTGYLQKGGMGEGLGNAHTLLLWSVLGMVVGIVGYLMSEFMKKSLEN